MTREELLQQLQTGESEFRVRVKKEWHAYVRLGPTDHRCNKVEEARFLRDASHETFEGMQVPSPVAGEG